MANYYVSPTGNNANPGTIDSPKADFSFFNSVTPKAGDTVFLRGGTYIGKHITLNSSGVAGNPITLRNYPGELPVLNGNDQASGSVCIFGSGQHYWNIIGLEIYNYYQGIIPRNNCSNIHIDSCKIHDISANAAVWFLDCTYSSLKNSLIYNNGWNHIAIQINYGPAHHIDIINNDIYGGIGSGHNLIDLNHNHGSGVSLSYFINNVNIIGNKLHDTIGGNSAIWIHGSTGAAMVPHLDYITVQDNIIDKVNRLSLDGLRYSTVINNKITNTVNGIYCVTVNWPQVSTTYSKNCVSNVGNGRAYTIDVSGSTFTIDGVSYNNSAYIQAPTTGCTTPSGIIISGLTASNRIGSPGTIDLTWTQSVPGSVSFTIDGINAGSIIGVAGLNSASLTSTEGLHEFCIN